MPPTARLDLNVIVKSFSGEPVKDMLEAKSTDTPDKAPDLTIGSLLGNGLLIGLKDIDKKQTVKVFAFTGKLQNALKNNEGIYEIEEDEINFVEEMWAKIQHPTFNVAMNSGAVLTALHNARKEILKKEDTP